jgi:hypothetical protein
MAEFTLLILFGLVSVGIFVWCAYMLIGEIGGAAFVPTNQEEIVKLLEKLKIRPGQMFYDLGSGDGRVVKLAVKKYQAVGVGVEINPWLILWSRCTSNWEGLKNIKFLRQDFWGVKIASADYIYFYMSPRSARKLGERAKKECKNGTTIISKAFEIKNLKDKLVERYIFKEKRYWIYKM